MSDQPPKFPPPEEIDVETLAEAMRQIGWIVYSAEDVDDMCPNCNTPWKCNGPHIVEPRGDANLKEAERLIAAYASLAPQERRDKEACCLDCLEVDEAGTETGACEHPGCSCHAGVEL